MLLDLLVEGMLVELRDRFSVSRFWSLDPLFPLHCGFARGILFDYGDGIWIFLCEVGGGAVFLVMCDGFLLFVNVVPWYRLADCGP